MKWLAKLKPESRKLIVLIVSVGAYLANDLTGRHVQPDTMLTCLGLVGAWLLAQGIADAGQQGAAIAVRRATQAGGAVGAAVAAAISRAPAPAVTDEAQPTWADTSAPDPAAENEGK